MVDVLALLFVAQVHACTMSFQRFPVLFKHLIAKKLDTINSKENLMGRQCLLGEGFEAQIENQKPL